MLCCSSLLRFVQNFEMHYIYVDSWDKWISALATNINSDMPWVNYLQKACFGHSEIHPLLLNMLFWVCCNETYGSVKIRYYFFLAFLWRTEQNHGKFIIFIFSRSCFLQAERLIFSPQCIVVCLFVCLFGCLIDWLWTVMPIIYTRWLTWFQMLTLGWEQNLMSNIKTRWQQ